MQWWASEDEGFAKVEYKVEKEKGKMVSDSSQEERQKEFRERERELTSHLLYILTTNSQVSHDK
jgi:hypothetical protein